MAIEKYYNTYWNDNKQFRAFMKWNLQRAYNTYTNHGLVKTDKDGNAELILNCPQPYKIGNVTYPRHVHYTFLLENIWSEQIHSTVVMCSINYKQMEKIVDDKSHFILNALDKDTFLIPNSNFRHFLLHFHYGSKLLSQYNLELHYYRMYNILKYLHVLQFHHSY